MLKKKLSTIILATTITNLVAVPSNVFAENLVSNISVEALQHENLDRASEAFVSNFGVSDENLQKYNDGFKIDSSKIIRASNTGGTSNGTNIRNVLDERLDTFWESGRVNTSTYNNEVEFEFDEATTINRIVYSAKRGTNRGFAQEFEIYASSTSEGEFELITYGQATPTQEAVEFKFSPNKVKKLKFVYKKGVDGWAAASEFGFYKEDLLKNKIQKLFTDYTLAVVSEEFNTIEKIEALEDEAKQHVLYSDFKEDIENAKALIKREEVIASETKVTKFKASEENLEGYNKEFKLDRENIIKASNTGGTSNQTKITNVLDGDLNTFWESGRVNSSTYNNEVEFEFDEIATINRIVYSAKRGTNRGFAQEFEVYASPTTKGDTFKLISSGKANATQDVLEFKFKPTDVKRIKFVYKKSVEGWAAASEFGFYTEDPLSDKVDRLFTDSTLSVVSEEFNTIEKIEALEEEVKSHPLWEVFKEDVKNAKALVKRGEVIASETKVTKFKASGDNLETYNKEFKLDRESIIKASNTGGTSNQTKITNVLDGDLNTFWESGRVNTSTYNNEVEFEFDEVTTINRIVYSAKRGTNRGFAQEFEIYVSPTTNGDTFKLISSGRANATQDVLEFKFKPTDVKRIKFVYKKGVEGWAAASEFGFYTEDIISDKVDRLFTDSTLSVVSEEFNTIEKLNLLEEEVKNHPLYEVFKEDIENAKIILQQEKIESTKSQISVFDIYNDENIENYNNQFKMDNDNIANIYTNGGSLGKYVSSRMLDGDLNTFWETGKQNSADFKNEIIFTLKEPTTLNRMVYRSADNKIGFAEDFEIWASSTSKGDTFQLVSTGETNRTSDILEFKFNPTEFKRIKFIYNKAYGNKASASEVMFYEEDVLIREIENIFTDGTMSALKPEYSNMDVITELEVKLNNHPFKNKYIKLIEVAKQIINENIDYSKTTFILKQNGNTHSKATDQLMMSSLGNDFQSTGIVAKPGEVFNIYVEADNNAPLPEIVFSQQEGKSGNWRRNYRLKKGLNTIVVPKIYDEGWVKKSALGGAVYLVNKYTPEQQGKAPIVRIEGGEKFPLFNSGDNVEEFLEELKVYNEKLNENPDTMVDIFEYNSKRLMFTGTAKAAYKVYINEGVDVNESISVWDNQLQQGFEFAGLKDDLNDPANDSTNIRATMRLMQPIGAAYASSDHMGYQRHVMDVFLRTDKNSINSIIWGTMHETGHQMDISERTWGEITNNMIANQAAIKSGKADGVDYDSIYKNLAPEESLKGFEDFGYFDKLGLFWQLQIMKDTYWAELESMYRERRPNIKDYQEKKDTLAKYSSEIMGVNLTKYYEKYKFTLSEEAKVELSQLPDLEVKPWYLKTSAMNYKGNGFNENINVSVGSSLNEEDKTVTLRLNIDNENKKDLLGYEIKKDGKVIGFTAGNNFVVQDIAINENTTYEVVAYAKNLSTAKAIEVKTFNPTLSIEDELTVKLNSNFYAKSYVKATSYNGEDISEDVIVESNVDTSKNGEYKVVYKVTNEGITETKSMKVNVVSDYTYLSDMKEVSATVEWDKLRKDTNFKGGNIHLLRDGVSTVYNKGLGAHANSEVIYDVKDKGYNYFESYIGMEQSNSNSRASVTFEVWVDGEKRFESSIFNKDTNREFIRVPISGASEVKIIAADANDGNASDHSMWAEAKFTTDNTKPVINVSDKNYKIGENVDFLSEITANDVEDGDLTSNIEIISNNYEEGKFGRFEVVYRVIDSDNNVTEKSSYITIYEELATTKSKYGEFNNLEEYNEKFKISAASVSNNGGNYGSSGIKYAIDNNRNTHWETGKPNNDSFKNEVIFDLGEIKEIDKIAYAARKGGKGFATKFEVYVSTEVEGNDFILAGAGSYDGSFNDVIEIDIRKIEARRVKFKFIEAKDGWASIAEMSFYKSDEVADKVTKELFTDTNKNKVSEKYNTLEKLDALREEVSGHLAAEFFHDDLNRAEEIIISRFPVTYQNQYLRKLGILES